MKIAIHKDKNKPLHPNNWVKDWVAYCTQKGLDFELVNCYEDGILEKLKNFDCLLWHFANYSSTDMMFARSILWSCQQMGLRVFPDMNTSWHFDDKVAESYLLRAIGAPIPDFHVFYEKQECLDWLNGSAVFPLVAKLRCGSGSNNVRLIQNASEGVRYTKKMFSSGYRNVPGVLFKATSNIRSVKSKDQFIKRLKKVPDFLRTRCKAKLLPKEKHYAYFQEYIENSGYDIRIKVVNGEKATFLIRQNRKGDFRASGGGDSNYNRELVNEKILEAAFYTSKALKMQTVGFDFIVDKRDGKPKILEMSYGFPNDTAIKAGGYWDEKFAWHPDPLDVAAELIKSMETKTIL